jgi:hypothetical protein
VLFNASKLKIEFDENLVKVNDIRKTVEKLDYKVLIKGGRTWSVSIVPMVVIKMKKDV